MDSGVQRREAFFTRRPWRSCEVGLGGMAIQWPHSLGGKKGGLCPQHGQIGRFGH